MLTCPRCHTQIGIMDCYCSHCGKTLKPRMGFWYSHGGIFLLSLLVGPFSLICVWLSRKISVTAKLFWTLGIVIFSVWLAYSVYKAVLLAKEILSSSLIF